MKFNRPLRAITCIFSFAILASCAGLYSDYSTDPIDPLDRSGELERKDFADHLFPKKPVSKKTEVEVKKTDSLRVPKLSEVLIIPKRPTIGVSKTVTLSVTEEVQLKDIFIELARLADIDIEVDPKIRGGIIFRAKNKPFDEVVQRICDLAGLRYTVNNGVLRVVMDTPYVENYQASFLNIIRKNTSAISSSSKLSGSSTEGGTSTSNGSESSISASNGGEGDLWASIEAEIKAIVGGGTESYVTLNREVGIISAKTSGANHEKIKQYLDQVQSYYSSQVLIEAKVVEVSLNDQFSSGIDWSALTNDPKFGNQFGLKIDTPADTATPSVANIRFSDTSRVATIKGAVDLAQIFGTTRTLSSPRILAMNGQRAVLSFARNESYFGLTCTVTDAVAGTGGSAGTPGKVDVSSVLKSVPVGVILNMQPSIDTKNNEVSMNIRPTLSRLTGVTYKDPSVTICVSNITANDTKISQATIDELIKNSTIPQVDVREMDSVLRLKSGEVMVIGGMIDQKDENTDSGVPFASEIPIIGNAFKKVNKRTQAVQTVIFLQATIVPGFGADKLDEKFYDKFETDPRPLNF